jgi:Tol biopolymer transport system component
MKARNKIGQGRKAALSWVWSSVTVLFLLVLFAAAASYAQVTERVSVASASMEANQRSYAPSISHDGRFVAFYSYASNLVENDTNGEPDVFVRDRQTGTTVRVSISSNEDQANGGSHAPFISADGRFVAFYSYASNLIGGDTNNCADIFVHDRDAKSTERVSVASNGVQGNDDSFLRLAISADGRFVAFYSEASNLVNDANGHIEDIFVHDRITGTTTCTSIDSSGNQGGNFSDYPSMSANGRFVAFLSWSTLVTDDYNAVGDVYVHDRETSITTRVSVHSDGTEANAPSYHPSISADGRYVAFHSAASNLVDYDTNGYRDVFVHDRQTQTTTLVSVDSNGLQGNNYSIDPSISPDGGKVAFCSLAHNLVSADANEIDDVFVHDRRMKVTMRVSVDSSGNEADNYSDHPSLSRGGRYVAFASQASNLVTNDTNAHRDIFVHIPPAVLSPAPWILLLLSP